MNSNENQTHDKDLDSTYSNVDSDNTTFDYTSILQGKDARRFIEQTLSAPMDELLKFPKYIMIETINWCNANCIMCGIDFSKKRRISMSDRMYTSIVQEISSHSELVRKVMLYLDCEPLGDSKLSSRIKELKKAGISNVNISSNASMLTNEIAIQLLEAGLDEMYITLDSLEKSTYESIRRGLKFELVYNNIINFIQARNRYGSPCKIRLQQVLQDANQGESKIFIKHWEPKLSMQDEVVIQYAHNWAGAVSMQSSSLLYDYNNFPCIGPFGTFCVHADGDITLCSMDVNKVFPVGNIVDFDGIAKSWNSSLFEKIRSLHLSKERKGIDLCSNCALWRKPHFSCSR